MKRRHLLLIQFGVALLVTGGILLTMSRQASEELPRMRTPDVDGLIHEYLASQVGAEWSRTRAAIHALGQPAIARLRVIALDGSRTARERCFAIEMLTANPQATFDLLSLIDDPETTVRHTARRVVRGCIADLPMPRDLQSETAAAELRRWRDANAGKGMGAHVFRDTPLPMTAQADTTLSPTQIFRAWSRDGSFHTRSPYLVDLRAHGDRAVRELIALSQSDSSYQRSCALIILGMLKNERATSYLESELARARSASDEAVLKVAISRATSSQ